MINLLVCGTSGDSETCILRTQEPRRKRSAGDRLSTPSIRCLLHVSRYVSQTVDDAPISFKHETDLQRPPARKQRLDQGQACQHEIKVVQRADVPWDTLVKRTLQCTKVVQTSRLSINRFVGMQKLEGRRGSRLCLRLRLRRTELGVR